MSQLSSRQISFRMIPLSDLKMPEHHAQADGSGEQFSNVSDIYDESNYKETARIVQEKGNRKLDEAVDMYGDVDTAQDYGYVNRG